MQKLYDVDDAGKILSVSKWTVRAYIRSGKLRPVRFGRLVRLTTAELTRFVAEASGEGLVEAAICVDSPSNSDAACHLVYPQIKGAI